MRESVSPVKSSSSRVHTAAKSETMSRKRDAEESQSSSPSSELSPTKRRDLGPSSSTTKLGPLLVGRNTPFQEPITFSSPKGRALNGTSSSSAGGRAFHVTYKPEGLWIAREKKTFSKENATTDKKLFYMSTSFIPLGLSIECNSMIKEIEIGCIHIKKVRVLFKGEESNKDGTGPKMSVKDIDVDQYDNSEVGMDENTSMSMMAGDKSGNSGHAPPMQRLVITPPYPCVTIEMMILDRNRDFISIFYVQCFSSSIRSSSQSTPVTKQDPKGKSKTVTNGILR